MNEQLKPEDIPSYGKMCQLTNKLLDAKDKENLYIVKKEDIFKAEQFIYDGDIDGKDAHTIAEKLGLSQNVPHSVLWEIKTNYGWEIVNYGDYILTSKHDRYPRVCSKYEFKNHYQRVNKG